MLDAAGAQRTTHGKQAIPAMNKTTTPSVCAMAPGYPRLTRLSRSEGVTTSVRQNTKLVIHHHDFPWAIKYPLTSTSMGSPARASSSTTDPCELQDVLDGDFGTSQLHRELNRNVQHHIDVVDRGIVAAGERTHGFTRQRSALLSISGALSRFCSSSASAHPRKRIVCGVGGIVVIVVFFQLTSFSPSQLISAFAGILRCELHISSCASHTDIQNRNTADRCLDARLAIQLNEISGFHGHNCSTVASALANSATSTTSAA